MYKQLLFETKISTCNTNIYNFKIYKYKIYFLKEGEIIECIKKTYR